MNQFVATLALSYAGTYIGKYAGTYLYNGAKDYVTNKVIYGSVNVVKNAITTKKVDPIEYEVICVNEENQEVILEPIMYVTSQERKKSIDQSWSDVTEKEAEVSIKKEIKFIDEMHLSPSFGPMKMSDENKNFYEIPFSLTPDLESIEEEGIDID